MIYKAYISISLLLISFSTLAQSFNAIVAQELMDDGKYEEAIAKCKESGDSDDNECEKIIQLASSKISEIQKSAQMKKDKKIAEENARKAKLDSKECRIANLEQTYCSTNASIQILQGTIDRELKIKAQSGVYNMKTLHDSTNAKIYNEEQQKAAIHELNKMNITVQSISCSEIKEKINKSCY